jgi:CheY-like chemotaxis protein
MNSRAGGEQVPLSTRWAGFSRRPALIDKGLHSDGVPVLQYACRRFLKKRPLSMSHNNEPPSTHTLILVVDDNPSVRTFISSILRHRGFGIENIEANNGVEALRIVRELAGKIDLLITDIQMPEMDGVCLARAVKEEFPSIPIIFVSGYSQPDELAKAEEPCAFIEKPFTPKVLVDAVMKCLDGNLIANA